MQTPLGPGRPRVAVVGGGISGLAAAWRLVNRPDAPQVLLLEQARSVGGKLIRGEVAGITVDLGAEAVLARRPEGTALMAELGLGDELVHPQTSAASVLRAGRLYPLPPGTVMGVPADPQRLLGLLTEAEVARAAAEPGVPAPPLPGDTDVASWVAERFGSAVLDRLVEPLLGGVYAGHANRLSLQATVPQLWQLARRGGSVLHHLRELAGPAGRPTEQSPPAAPDPVFAGLTGGVALLAARLAERLSGQGVEVRTGVTVRELHRTPSGWRLMTGPVPTERPIDVDAVLLAVPPAPAARLLAGPCPPAAALLAGVPTASMAVIAAAVPRAVTAGIAGSGVLVPPVEGRLVKAVTFSSSKWAWVDAQNLGLVLVRMSVGRYGEESALQRDDDELVALATADLAGLLARPVQPVEARVVRWGGGLPQYEVGHVPRMDSVRAAVAALPGLAICGAAFDGLGIPACIAAAGAATGRLDGYLDGFRHRAGSDRPAPV